MTSPLVRTKRDIGAKTSVFFDLDGTLCDPRDGIVRCLRYAFERLGYPGPPDDHLERYIGPPLQETFATLLETKNHEVIERAVALYRQRFISHGMYENTVYPGIAETLALLRSESHRLYVVTSKPSVFAEKILVHFGLQRFFQNVYGSELDGRRSDKGDLIAHVLREEKISPSDAVMVGDREHDIEGALANGVFPIGALWGYGTREKLAEANAALLCESPKALANWLCFPPPLAPVAPRIADRKVKRS
jgi:phosphoglycolate phosphatase